MATDEPTGKHPSDGDRNDLGPEVEGSESPRARSNGRRDSAERWALVQRILGDLKRLETSGARDATIDAALKAAADGDRGIEEQVRRLREFEDDLGSFLEEPALLDREWVDGLGPTAAAGGGLSGRATPWSVALEPGASVGPYEILALLGHGGMGEVYHAVRRDPFEQHVALKVVKGGLRTVDVLRRFGDERQILARLEHPLIARLIDGGTTDEGRPYLAMEKIDGEPIDTWCDRQRLGIEERLRLFLRVLEAVTYAHRSAVVHRDLKPSNVLVDRNGDPRLLDFGIAKLIDQGPERGETTRIGARPLTLPYASPEQIQGAPPAMVADVYSLGVVLYRLLTGAFPHEVTTEYDTLKQIVEVDPQTASLAAGRTPEAVEVARSRGLEIPSLRRKLRGDLDAILDRALARDPEKRYVTVDRFAVDLEAYLEKRPVAARRGALSYRARRWAARNAAALLVAVLGLSLLLGWAGTSFSQWQKQQRIESDRIAESDRRADSQQLLIELFAETDPGEVGETSNAKFEAIGELLDDFEEKVRGRDDPAFRASAFEQLAYVRLGRDEIDQAERLIVDSLRLREEKEGRDPPSPRIAIADSLYGSILVEQSRLDEALERFEQARATLAQSGDRYGGEWARAVNNLGRIYVRQGEWDKAEARLREALALKRRFLPGDRRSEAVTLTNLAGFLRKVGRRDEAIEIHEGIVEWADRDDETADLERASASRNSLGALYMDRGDYQRALESFDRALSLRQQYLKNSEGEGYLLLAGNRGVALARLGRPDEAIQPLQAVVDQLSRKPPDKRLVRYRLHLASALAAAGRESEARRDARLAFEMAAVVESDAETRAALEDLLRGLGDSERPSARSAG